MKRGQMRSGNSVKAAALFLAVTTLLGTSYAHWTQTTVMESKVMTGNISATASLAKDNDNYMRLCVNLACDDEDKFHTATPVKIDFKSSGTVPVGIESAKIIRFTYYKPTYKCSQVNYIEWNTNLLENVDDWNVGVMNDFWHQDWGRYKEFTRTSYQYAGAGKEQSIDLSGNLEQLFGEFKPYTSKNGVTSLDYEDGAKAFRQAIEQLISTTGATVPVTNGKDYDFSEYPLACIDASMEGTITLSINYSQFNTIGQSGGWKGKTDNITIPVKWMRAVMADSNWQEDWYRHSSNDSNVYYTLKDHGLWVEVIPHEINTAYMDKTLPSQDVAASRLNIYPKTEEKYIGFK